MKGIAAIVVLALIACASAGIISPYVGYPGYYSAPLVSRAVVSRGVVSPYASAYASPYASPYVSSYVASPYVRRYVAAPVAAPVYSSAYVSPYGTYSYLLKK